jgi:hypothetical protein
LLNIISPVVFPLYENRNAAVAKRKPIKKLWDQPPTEYEALIEVNVMPANKAVRLPRERAMNPTMSFVVCSSISGRRGVRIIERRS